MRILIWVLAWGVLSPCRAEHYWQTDRMQPRLLSTVELEVEPADGSFASVPAIAHANTRTNKALRWGILALDLVSLGKFNPLLNLVRQQTLFSRDFPIWDARIEYGALEGFNIPISIVRHIEHLGHENGMLAIDELGWWQPAHLLSVRFPATPVKTGADVQGKFVFEAAPSGPVLSAPLDTLESFPSDALDVNHPAIHNGVINLGRDPLDSIPVLIHSISAETLYVVRTEDLKVTPHADRSVYGNIPIFAVSRAQVPPYNFASPVLFQKLLALSPNRKAELAAELGRPVLVRTVKLTHESNEHAHEGIKRTYIPRDLRYVLYELRTSLAPSELEGCSRAIAQPW